MKDAGWGEQLSIYWLQLNGGVTTDVVQDTFSHCDNNRQNCQ